MERVTGLKAWELPSGPLSQAALHNSASAGAGLTHPLISVAHMDGDMASVDFPKQSCKILPGQLCNVWNKSASKNREIYEKKLKLKPSKRLV